MCMEDFSPQGANFKGEFQWIAGIPVILRFAVNTWTVGLDRATVEKFIFNYVNLYLK
jgi:hypothetical protein